MIKLRKVILFLLLFCLVTTLFSQNVVSQIDSLKQSLETANRKDKISILTKITLYYLDFDPPQSIEYGNRALALAKRNDNELRCSQLLSLIGVAYEYMGNQYKALEFYTEALDFARVAKDEFEIANCYVNLANVNQNISKQDISLDYNIKALGIYRFLNHDVGISKSLNNIGNVYLSSKRYDKALSYYLQSLEYKEKIDDDYSLSTGLHNLGLTYQSLEDYDNALVYYDRALKLMQNNNDVFSIAVCFGNIANLYLEKQNVDMALDYTYRAFDMYEKLGNQNGIALLLNKIAEINMTQDNYTDVVDLILKSLDSAKELNNYDLISQNYKLLSEYYEKTDKIENALLFFKKYTAINDSISSEAIAAKIVELSIQYESDQRIKEIEFLKKDAENQVKIKNFLIYALVLGIVVVVFLLNLYFDKIRDVKLRLEISEKLHESEIRFRSLTENLTGCVYTFDVTGIFTYVNPSASRITGYTEAELLNMKFYDLIHPLHKDMVSHRGFDRLQGQDVESNYDFKILTKSGEVRWLQTASIRITIGNQLLILGSAHDITERKNTSNKLEESEAKMRALFAAMKDVIMVIDRAGKYLDIAPTNEELLYKPSHKLLNSYIPDIFDEEMSNYFLSKINGSLDRKETLSVDYMLNINGKDYWFEGRISPMTENSVIMVVRDSTQRLKATNKLKESEQSYRELVESIEEGMVITDNQMNFTFANKAASRIYGYSIEKILQLNVKDIVPQDQFELIEEQYALRTKSISSQYENWNITKDGRKILINVSSTPLIKDGKVEGTIALFNDITEMRIAEEKIKASLKEKEVMLQEIYHRVKNNMQVISSMLKLQSLHINQSNALEVFANSQHRVKSMSLVHEKLYRSADLSRVDFKDYLNSLMKQLHNSWKIHESNITSHIQCVDVNLNVSTAIPCGLIVNEVVTNSLKHAFHNKKNGKIFIVLEEITESKFKLTLADDGDDFPDMVNFENASTFGMQLIEILRQQLKADVIINRETGTKIIFTFNELQN